MHDLWTRIVQLPAFKKTAYYSINLKVIKIFTGLIYTTVASIISPIMGLKIIASNLTIKITSASSLTYPSPISTTLKLILAKFKQKFTLWLRLQSRIYYYINLHKVEKVWR